MNRFRAFLRTLSPREGPRPLLRETWGFSSAGRAIAWHAIGQRFDSAKLHHEGPQLALRAFAFSDIPGVIDIRVMKLEPSIFDAADEAALAEGEADLAAGRVISHEAIKAWLLSWGTGDERRPPKVGD